LSAAVWKLDGKFTSTTRHGGIESDCGSAWPGSVGGAASTGAIMKFEKLGNFNPWWTLPAAGRSCRKLVGAR
jgi:hypothetical protein